MGQSMTSLGLAIATWVGRLGLAVTLCVFRLHPILNWLVIDRALFFTTDQTSLPLCRGSPPTAALFATAIVAPDGTFISESMQLVWACSYGLSLMQASRFCCSS